MKQIAFRYRVAIFFLLFLSLPEQSLAERVDDPSWQQFIVGKVSDLPEGPVKKFLTSSHNNNPYGRTIRDQMAVMGPFAPEADSIFWIPTIDMPLNAENWRFLSSLEDLPKSILQTAIVTKNGRKFVRMFLHPYSVEESKFVKLAEKFGGFHYEFQGSPTASARSLIAWKTARPKPVGSPGVLDFPSNPETFVWAKVSVSKVDIVGQRLNKAKQMVRAYAVTQLMDEIPKAMKQKEGFNFAGEWVVGVPSGTDSGYAARELLPDFTARDGSWVEPGFSLLSPSRLNEVTRGVEHPELYVREKIVRPLMKTFSYLLMEEGMFGEYHTQNLNFVIGKDGKPTGKVLLHDAEAFRVSTELRALGGKSIAPLRKIENPFFFTKDSVFRKGGTSGLYSLNGLSTYFAETRDMKSVVGSIAAWCAKNLFWRKWCTQEKIQTMLLDVFSEELSPYLHRKVNASELRYFGDENNGLFKLFQERLRVLGDAFPEEKEANNIAMQKLLSKEYQRLSSIGMAKSSRSGLTPENAVFSLHVDGDSAFIAAISKDGKKKVYGIALLGTASDPSAVKFANAVNQQSGLRIPLMARDNSQPIMRRLGGGSNLGQCSKSFQGLR